MPSHQSFVGDSCNGIVLHTAWHSSCDICITSENKIYSRRLCRGEEGIGASRLVYDIEHRCRADISTILWIDFNVDGIMIKPRKRTIVVAAIMLVTAILCIYFYFDPSDHFFPRCPFLTMTGLECPGCGSQRAIHALLHGDLLAVWHYNAALYLFIPLLVILGIAELSQTRAPKFYWAVNSRPVIWGSGIFIVLWWIIRNIM